MNIPEILDYLYEADLEDWLTAAFIENESLLPLNQLCTEGRYPSSSRPPDIWMVELTDRSGKFWSGRFNVEFFEENCDGVEKKKRIESQTKELYFMLDTETAEVTFQINAADASEIGGRCSRVGMKNNRRNIC
jgi:hypothetical protein